MTSSVTNAPPSSTALDMTPRTLSTTTASAAMPTTITVSTTRSTTTVPRTVVRLTPSPFPEGVDADELAETGRQHVVREIPEVGVAEDAPVRDRRDRGQQDLPAGRAHGDVDEDRDQHDGDPGGDGPLQDRADRLRGRPSGGPASRR